ncbi:MAG: hypothetical protein ACRD25_06835 [Terracidiphilus sp.]
MTAASPIHHEFVHRSNRDGTTDTICRNCFATVATAIWEAELERKERSHDCDPWTIQRFQKLGRREVRRVVLPWHLPA